MIVECKLGSQLAANSIIRHNSLFPLEKVDGHVASNFCPAVSWPPTFSKNHRIDLRSELPAGAAATRGRMIALHIDIDFDMGIVNGLGPA